MDRRRDWRHWLIGAAVVLAAAAAVAVPAIADSDWYTLSYKSLSEAPKPLPIGQVPDDLRVDWSAHGVVPGTGITTTPSTVVTADEDQITGRDPVSGAERWHYRRGNTTLCSWTMEQNTAIAVFRNGDSCSDITGFNADTGRRRWYLNADLPRGVRLIPGNGIYYALDSTDVTGFYLEGGSKAWSYHKKGCTPSNAVAGDVGLVILAECNGRVDLIGVDGYTGKERFDVPAPGGNPRLLSADTDIVLASDTGQETDLTLLSADGRVVGLVADPHRAGSTRQPLVPPTVADGRWYGYDGTRVMAVDLKRPQLLWTASATGSPLLTDDSVLVPTKEGLRRYHLDGTPEGRIPVSVPPLVDGLEQVGTHLVVRAEDSVTGLG